MSNIEKLMDLKAETKLACCGFGTKSMLWLIVIFPVHLCSSLLYCTQSFLGKVSFKYSLKSDHFNHVIRILCGTVQDCKSNIISHFRFKIRNIWNLIYSYYYVIVTNS